MAYPPYRRKPEQPRHDRFDKATLAVAVVGVVVLAVSAGIMAWQAIETHEAVMVSAEATAVANRQWLTARDTEERQLRAYISVDAAAETNFGHGLAPIFHVVLKNAGQTPAYNVRAMVGTDMNWFPIHGAYRTATATQPTPSVLGPGGLVHGIVPTARVLTDEENTDIATGIGAIYGFGTITYLDAFKRPHYTKFRFYYGGDAGTRSDGLMKPTAIDNDAN